MSHDGSFVFFQSPVGLTPGALNDVPIGSASAVLSAAYSRRMCMSGMKGMCIWSPMARDLTSTAEYEQRSVRLLGSDATGANVFFETADRSRARRTPIRRSDVYDARIGGGIPYIPPRVAVRGEERAGVRRKSAPSLRRRGARSFSVWGT